MKRKPISSIIVLLCSFLLSGCQGFIDRYADRYGPPAVISATDLSASTKNQIDIFEALAKVSSFTTLPSSPSDDWYSVMEGGFNYVDERCNTYLKDMFITNREKDRIKGLFVLADKASSAILAASNAGKDAISVVAQSFGFAEGSTDILANSYLFQIDPSHIRDLVMSMREVFRQQAYARRHDFRTPAAAYHGLQQYLEICLPQTIESKINEIVGRAKAFPDLTTPAGSSIELIIGADPSLSRGEGAAAQNLTPQTPARQAPPQPPVKPAPSQHPVNVIDPTLRTQLAKVCVSVKQDEANLAALNKIANDPSNADSVISDAKDRIEKRNALLVQHRAEANRFIEQSSGALSCP